MTLREAYALLDAAPADDTPARINPNLTKKVAVEMVRNAIATMDRSRDLPPRGLDDEISPLSEKRVLQVTKNRTRV